MIDTVMALWNQNSHNRGNQAVFYLFSGLPGPLLTYGDHCDTRLDSVYSK